jgi:hypothetical protein
MGYLKHKYLEGMYKDDNLSIPKAKLQKKTTEFKIQEVDEDIIKDKLREKESQERLRGLGCGNCICGNKLSRSEFRDESGEVEGWIVECLECGRVYDED